MILLDAGILPIRRAGGCSHTSLNPFYNKRVVGTSTFRGNFTYPDGGDQEGLGVTARIDRVLMMLYPTGLGVRVLPSVMGAGVVRV